MLMNVLRMGVVAGMTSTTGISVLSFSLSIDSCFFDFGELMKLT